MNETIAGLLIGGVVVTIMIASGRWQYKHCLGRDKCPYKICRKYDIYGCPVSPHGFLTEEERKELKKKIDELD